MTRKLPCSARWIAATQAALFFYVATASAQIPTRHPLANSQFQPMAQRYQVPPSAQPRVAYRPGGQAAAASPYHGLTSHTPQGPYLTPARTAPAAGPRYPVHPQAAQYPLIASQFGPQLGQSQQLPPSATPATAPTQSAVTSNSSPLPSGVTADIPTPSGSRSAIPVGTQVEPTPTPEPTVAVEGDSGAGYYSSVYSSDACNYCYGQGNYSYGGQSNYGSGTCGYGGRWFDNKHCRKCRWFVGVYGLVMQRDRSNDLVLSTRVNNTTSPPAAYPYWPTSSEISLRTSDLDQPYQGGAEIRFGGTFGVDPCSCACTEFGWEIGYWGIAPETETLLRVDDGATRMYSMVDFGGLEYDRDGPGGGAFVYRPVNDYYDYGHPVDDPATTTQLEVAAQRVRSSFSAQSVEINFLRIPIVSFGWGGCATDGCCGTDSCGVGGCGTCGGANYWSSPCSSCCTIVGLAGFRYLRFDEDFQFANEIFVAGDPYVGFSNTDDKELYYNIDLDNELVGFQLGASGKGRIGCKSALHVDTTFGLYNNHISMWQRMGGPGGGFARWVTNGNDFNVRSTKDDLAFVGELRLGASHQIGKYWRLYGGWRAIAVTGVALSTHQVRPAFIDAANIGRVQSNGSLILHGLQAGIGATF